MDNIRTHKVRMYNDDHNSFLYVMACLIKHCSHEPVQAEQCAMIAERAGHCDIKSGDFIDMFELKNNLESLDIKVDLLDYESHLYQ
jgi:ATP-dependent Clp protease adaptor protein ClpS